MNKILAVNSGSSSLKWKLFQLPEETVIASGDVDRLGISGSVFTVKYGDGEKFQEKKDIKTHKEAVTKLLESLKELNIVPDFSEITGVGHRVVSGGEKFTKSTIITPKTLAGIKDCINLAPLHNPAEIDGIEAFTAALPHALEVAVFDTAFHTTLPAKNYLYSLPMEYYHKYQARKYGAHGTSHRYVSQRAAEILGKPYESLRLVSMHLGNGASLCAIKNGKSYDTSMGFTPLAGVTMSTRSGDIDASLVDYLQTKLNVSAAEMTNILNTKSGLLGLSGVSSDMRDIEDAANNGNEDAKVAIDIFISRIANYGATYINELNGADAIIFTAGIGENSVSLRKEIIDQLSVFGVKIDDNLNNVRGKEQIISTADSKIKVILIPTNEELMIARDVVELQNETH